MAGRTQKIESSNATEIILCEDATSKSLGFYLIGLTVLMIFVCGMMIDFDDPDATPATVFIVLFGLSGLVGFIVFVFINNNKRKRIFFNLNPDYIIIIDDGNFGGKQKFLVSFDDARRARIITEGEFMAGVNDTVAMGSSKTIYEVLVPGQYGNSLQVYRGYDPNAAEFIMNRLRGIP